MQNIIGSPREALTEAQVQRVIQDSPAMIMSAGAEIVNQSLQLIEDISDDMAQSGSVSRNNYNTLHGSCRLTIRRPLDWAQVIVRPYLNLSDGEITARFNLGAYYLNVPRQDMGESLPLYSAEGYDILHRLNDPTGEAYAVTSGTSVLDAVEAILLAQGYTKYKINRKNADKVFPDGRFWQFDENATWLKIVNEMLASVGYQGIWSDWDGWLQAQPYTLPSERGAEWTYDNINVEASTIYPQRAIEKDYFDAPNRWVFYRTNMPDETAPVAGDGIYTYTNTNIGETSVASRGGRTITKPVGVEAADQDALIARAQITIDADMRLKTSVFVATSVNPLHWHFDRMYIRDPSLGLLDVLGASWTLPLRAGETMQHEWTVLER